MRSTQSMSKTVTGELAEWSGQLSETPLLAVLRRIFLEDLTGALVVSQGDEGRSFFFERGELRTARSSDPGHRIGVFLKSWGTISQERLDWALNIQQETGEPLHKILVENGIVTGTILDAEAKRLMEMIMHSTLAWSDGLFHFQAMPEQAFSPDVTFTLSTAAVIIEGIRRIPESDKFFELLGDPSRIPLLARETTQYQSIPLPTEVAYFLWLIDGKTSVSNLMKLVPIPPKSAAKILYSLVYCGLVKLREPEEARRQMAEARVPADRKAASADDTVTRSSSFRREPSARRKLVVDLYRRIDWISLYDLLGVSTQATGEEIEEAYRIRSCLFGPDARPQEDLAGCEHQLAVLSTRLRLARDVLINPAAREAYGRKVREGEMLIEQAAAVDAHTTAAAPTSPSSTEVRLLMASRNYEQAKELLQKNEYRPAIWMLEEAIRLDPQNGEYRYILGLVQVKSQHSKEQGIENLKAAAKLEPERPPILAALAKALHAQGLAEEAKPFVEKALQLSPGKEEYLKIKRDLDSAIGGAKPKGVLHRITRSK